MEGGVHVGRVCVGGVDVCLPGGFGLLLSGLESGICARAAFKAICGLFGCDLVVCSLTPAAARRGLVWGLSVGVGRVRVVGAVADGKQSAQGVLAGIAAGCTGDLAGIIAFFILLLPGPGVDGHLFACLNIDKRCGGPDVIPVADLLEGVGQQYERALCSGQRLDSLKNALAVAVVIFAIIVVLVFWHFQGRLDSGQFGPYTHVFLLPPSSMNAGLCRP